MKVLVFVVVAAALSGCVSSTGSTGKFSSQVAANKPVEVIPLQTAWTMPWQLDPESAVSQAQGEQIYTAYIPEIGEVRGTRTAISFVKSPLNVSEGRNRTLGPCRDLLSKEAQKYGAAKVEATSLGPDRRSRDKTFEGPVGVRIFYPTSRGYQVRQAALTCKVDVRGKVLDAYVAPMSQARFTALHE
jgi:hypothetical protein